MGFHAANRAVLPSRSTQPWLLATPRPGRRGCRRSPLLEWPQRARFPAPSSNRKLSGGCTSRGLAAPHAPRPHPKGNEAALRLAVPAVPQSVSVYPLRDSPHPSPILLRCRCYSPFLLQILFSARLSRSRRFPAELHGHFRSSPHFGSGSRHLLS